MEAAFEGGVELRGDLVNLILLGPPGAGKGTQARRLSENLKIPQISTGDLLRTARANKTALGMKAEEYMTTGRLVPDGLVVEMIEDRLGRNDCSQGFIMDGFPRTLAQAEAFEKTVQKMGLTVDRVVNLDVERDELVARLSGRRQCRACGENYHMVFHPPRQENICDRCGGDLFQRDDDREDVIRKRLDVYDKETLPLVDYYQGKGLLKNIPGRGSIDDIYRQIEVAVS